MYYAYVTPKDTRAAVWAREHLLYVEKFKIPDVTPDPKD